MNYPDCPDSRSDCRFVSLGASMTLMYSPIVYDKDGKPVGGGANRITSMVECRSCGKFFISNQTELQRRLKEPRNWISNAQA
jgi:hypothetical protein